MFMDYHLVFIIISIILLLMTFIFIWFCDEKERLHPALLLVGLNFILSEMIWMGFFGIDVFGYVSDGSIVVNTEPGMYPYFGFFFVIWMMQIVLVFYIWYKHTQIIFDIEEKENEHIDWGY